MKKIISSVLVIFFGVVFIFASPSLDGRAVVAEDGELPRGLFAKTVGYLPGDTISVTNPTDGKSAEILVIGALDPTEGIAILLSPEAANCLKVEKNSDMLVKLTKRSSDLEVNAYGTCVLTSSPDSNKPTEEVAEEVIEEVATGEVIEELLPETKAIEEVATEEVLPESEVIEEVAEEVVAEEVATEEVIEEPLPETKAIEEVAAEEVLPESEVTEEVVEEVAAEEVIEEPLPETEAIEEVAAEEVIEEPLPETKAIEEVAAEEVIEEVLPESEVIEEDFEAIVLIPTEENPPVVETVEESEEVVKEKSIEEVTEEDATDKVIEEVVQPREKSTSKKMIVIEKLEKQKYYIQIATYKNIQNVDKIYDEYGEKYPVVVEQRKDKNVVLIGPLSVDEYGTVVQRFKSFGFKDAFIRKGK